MNRQSDFFHHNKPERHRVNWQKTTVLRTKLWQRILYSGSLLSLFFSEECDLRNNTLFKLEIPWVEG